MSVGNRGIQQGWEVYTADDEHIGTVREDRTEYLHVHHGRLFGKDEYHFPAWAIGRVEPGRVYLTLAKAEIEGKEWAAPTGMGDMAAARLDASAATPTQLTGASSGATASEGYVLDQHEVVVPVVEERIDITKRAVELGEVVINRQVTERQETVPVEVAHEEVRVERRPAGREATIEDLRLAGGEGLAGLTAGQSIVIPLIEEVVEVRKRMMVREELVITKQRVSEQHQVTETVRRVEPQIESAGRLERDVVGSASGAAASSGAGLTRTTGATDGGAHGLDMTPNRDPGTTR